MKYITLTAFLAYVAVFSSWQRLTIAKDLMKPCKSEKDCPKGHCCVSMAFWRTAKGHCAPFLKEGESCIPDVEDLKNFNDNFFMACPCEKGLACKPTFLLETLFMGKVSLNETCTAPATTRTSPSTTSTSPSTTSTSPSTTSTSSAAPAIKLSASTTSSEAPSSSTAETPSSTE